MTQGEVIALCQLHDPDSAGAWSWWPTWWSSSPRPPPRPPAWTRCWSCIPRLLTPGQRCRRRRSKAAPRLRLTRSALPIRMRATYSLSDICFTVCARPDAGHHRRHRLRQIDAGQPHSPLLRGQPGQLKGGRCGRARLPDGAAARQGGYCAAEGGALFRHAAPEHAVAQAGRHR